MFKPTFVELPDDVQLDAPTPTAPAAPASVATAQPQRFAEIPDNLALDPPQAPAPQAPPARPGPAPKPSTFAGPTAQYGQPQAQPGKPQAQPGKPQIVEGASYQEGHFGDDHVVTVHRKLSDAEVNEYRNMLLKGANAAQLRGYLHARGLFPGHSNGTDPNGQDNVDDLIYARDVLHKGVSDQYDAQLPPAHSQGAYSSFTNGIADSPASLGLANKGAAFLEAIGIGTRPGHENIWNSKLGFGDLYNSSLDNVNAELAGDRIEHPYLYTAGQIAGGFVIPTGITAETATLGGLFKAEQARALAAGASEANARMLAANAVRARATQAGAVTGGAYGFNSTDGSIGQKLAGGIVGGAEGAVLGNVLTANSYKPTAAPRAEGDGMVAQDAAARLRQQGYDINLTPPVVGGGTTRRMAGGLEQTLGGNAPLRSAAEGMSSQVEAATNRAAVNAGDAQPTTTNLLDAATKARDPNVPGSLASYEAESAIQKDSLYNAAAAEAGDARVRTPNMIQYLDAQIDRLRQNPSGEGPRRDLEALRETLANGEKGDGTWTVQGLRDLRTTYGEGLDATKGTTRRLANGMWGEGTEDIVNGLRQSGKNRAAVAYRKADAFNAAREDNLSDVVPEILGRSKDLSAEDVAAKLVSLSRRDGARLSRALDLMDPQNRSDTVASLVARLGSKGDGESQTFSPSTWASNWRDMSTDTKRLIFKGQTRDDLNSLADIVSSVNAADAFRNRSNTAGAVNVLGVLKRAAHFAELVGGGAAGFHAGSIETAAGTTIGLEAGRAVGSYVASKALGKALASPKVARILVAIGRGKPIEWGRRALTEVVARNPAIQQDVLPLVQAMNKMDGAQPE